MVCVSLCRFSDGRHRSHAALQKDVILKMQDASLQYFPSMRKKIRNGGKVLLRRIPTSASVSLEHSQNILGKSMQFFNANHYASGKRYRLSDIAE